jgi:signal recognition particle receptor subunit beta
MVFFNYATMQMAAKIVYYGPGLCGKTTNLHHIYAKTSPQSRGEMVSLETESDRTLFFDLLPIDVGVIGGFKTRLQLYTIPGQVFYNTTRKLVLKGVDGLVFVADSQIAMLDANMDSFKNLRENLAEIGLSADDLPLVIQLNKRDLPNVAAVDSLLDALDPERKFEYVEAVASSGEGVFETLKLISKLTLRTLRRRMTGDDAAKPAARRSISDHAQFRVKDDAQPHSVSSTVSAAALAEEIEEIPAADEIPAEPVTVAAAPAAQTQPMGEVDFRQTTKPAKSPEVKTVKVRSTIDVMAELEALRKRATQTTPKTKKDSAASRAAALGREIHKAMTLSIPAGILEQARSLRVTVSFEAGEAVVHQQSEAVELEGGPDVQSVSLNVRVDQE